MSASDPPQTTTVPSRDPAETRTATAANPMPARATVLRPGASVGRFLLLKCIGEGGMGSVWTAYDGDLDRKVALKLVRPDRTEDDDVRARMVREAQALARLSHPNVVTVHEVGVHDDGVYLAMEYVEGETLKTWMAREPPGSNERFERMLDIMQQAGRGLAAAHAAGMVHRDFKPANVIVGVDGRVRVVDFGLARAQEAPDPEVPVDELVATFRSEARRSASGGRVALHESVTQTGAFIGTPRYMSPEQFEGRRIDARSDVFSFSTVLFEAAHGRSPWAGGTASAIYSQILDGPPPTPDDTTAPPWLTKTIRRALSPKPSQRPISMNAMLESLIDPNSGTRRASRGVIAIAAIAVAAALLPLIWLAREEPQQLAACEQMAARGEAMWNEDVRDRVRTAYRQTAVPYSEAAFASVDAELTRYTSEWSRAATTTCVAVHGQTPRLDAAELHAELECLDLAAIEFGALVDLYESADAAAVERALDGATALTPVTWCADEGARRLRDEGEDVVDLRAQLARAKSLARLARTTEARSVIQSVADDALRLGLGALRGEALLELGRIQSNTQLSRIDLENAYWLSFGANDDRGAARAAIELVRRSPDLENASSWRRHAHALIARLDRDPELAAALQVALGMAAGVRGDYELACDYQADALRALEPITDALDFGRLSAVYALGLAYGDAERHGESIAELRRALEIVDARLGVDHPQAARIHATIGMNHLAQHEFAAAELETRKALDILAKNPTVDRRTVANARRILGEALVLGGKRAEGRAVLDAALAEMPQGLDERTMAEILVAIGTADILDGRPRQSLAYFLRSFELERMTRGATHPRLAITLNRITVALEALGDHEGAIMATLHAADLLTRSGDHLDAAFNYANLGVIAQSQKHWAEAILFCRHAIDLYQRSGRKPDSRLSFPLRVMALSLIELERPELAIAPLERALVLHSTSAYDRSEIPKTRLALARALWDSDADRPRARQLAAEAESELVGSNRRATEEFREVKQWLSSH